MSCLWHKTKMFFSEKLISFHFALVYEGGGDVYSLFVQVSKHEIYMLTKGQVTTKVGRLVCSLDVMFRVVRISNALWLEF